MCFNTTACRVEDIPLPLLLRCVCTRLVPLLLVLWHLLHRPQLLRGALSCVPHQTDACLDTVFRPLRPPPLALAQRLGRVQVQVEVQERVQVLAS